MAGVLVIGVGLDKVSLGTRYFFGMFLGIRCLDKYSLAYACQGYTENPMFGKPMKFTNGIFYC